MLSITNLNASYGRLQVLWDVSLKIEKRRIVALVGSNGAGKSTLLKVISGLLKPKSGDIFFKGKSIISLQSDEIVRKGISLIPEGRELFPGLTVRENLMMGAYIRSDKKAIKKELEFVYDLFPILKERQSQLAGTLSGGEQQMCAIARGLMSHPELILIDEPSLGLAPIIVDKVIEIIKQIHNMGITILLVEQDVQVALEISHYAYLIETGRIVKQGDSDKLLNDEHLKSAYLGI